MPRPPPQQLLLRTGAGANPTSIVMVRTAPDGGFELVELLDSQGDLTPSGTTL